MSTISSNDNSSSHGRGEGSNSNSNSGGNWFTNMMAPPRPSTPTNNHSSHSNHGGNPPLLRVPSEDALQRSLHNDSGHGGGKSSARIIQDLRASNAKWSQKTADMEAEFMNQLTEMGKNYDERLEAAMRQQATLEQRCAGAERKIRERDAQTAQLKEEAAFQRHTVADLKNQLYQLQHDMEEAEYDRTDEVDKWALERTDLLREMDLLRTQLQKYRENEKEEGDGGEQKLFEELEETKTKLYETQSQLYNMENDFKRQQKEHQNELSMFKTKLLEQESIAKKKELEMVDRMEDGTEQIQDLKEQLSERDGTIDALREETAKLASQLADSTKEIGRLKAQGQADDEYRAKEAMDLRVLQDSKQQEIDSLKAAVEDLEKELDVKEEALMDSAEEKKELMSTVEKLESALTQTQKTTVAKGDEQMELLRTHLELSQLEVSKLEQELKDANEKHKLEVRDMKELENELNDVSERYNRQVKDSHKELQELENELQDATQQHQDEVQGLRSEIRQLTAERDDVETRLKKVEDERDDQIRKLRGECKRLEDNCDRLKDSLEEAAQISNESLERGNADAEGRAAQRLKEVVSNSAKERAELETKWNKQVEELSRQREEQEAQLVDTKKELNRTQVELVEKSKEIEALHARLAESRKAQIDNDTIVVDAENVKGQLKTLEEKYDKAKKQLKEAQIALVALDDEKVAMLQTHKDQILELENQRGEMEWQYQNQLAAIEPQLQASNNVAEYIVEIDKLRRQVTETERELEVAKTKARNLETSNSGPSSVPTSPTTLGRELKAAKETEIELARTLQSMKEDRDEQERKFREKLEDRDTTISALVKSSVTQESKVASLKSEITQLKQKLETSSRTPVKENEALHKARNAEYIEEIEKLQATVDEHKDAERRLKAEVESLEKRLFANETELRRLRDHRAFTINSARSLDTEQQEKLQERDAAIAQLVKQSMSLEAEVSQLRLENSALKKNERGIGMVKAAPSWDEVKRLQNESEIFAGQIIEQDEEMEALRVELQEKEKKIGSLLREISALKRKASRDLDSERVTELQAEIDEIQEANATQRAELRELRKQLREYKSRADDAQDLQAELQQARHTISQMKVSKDDSELRLQLEEAIAAKEGLERKNSQTVDAMRRQRNSAVESLEERLKEKEQIIKDLERDHEEKLKQKERTIDELEKELDAGERVTELEEEIQRLNDELDDQTDMLADAKHANKELKRVLEETTNKLANATKGQGDEKAEALRRELQDLQSQMEMFEEDKAHIELMKERLSMVDDEKEVLEKNIVDTYERRMNLMQMNKDVIIDGLRKELSQSKSTTMEQKKELEQTVQNLKVENKDLQEELEAKLQLKNTKIQALEQTLGAQEQLVENMRSEMDHLQTSMQRTSLSRRAEIEEMQQEMINTSSKAQRQEREITALKLELEEAKLSHKSEVVMLKDQIKPAEPQQRMTEVKARHDDKVNDMKERLETVKWRNTTLNEENAKLRSRLERAELEGATSLNEKYKASKLEEQVKELRIKIVDLEAEKAVLTAKLQPSSSSPTRGPQDRPSRNGFSTRSRPPVAESGSSGSSSRLGRARSKSRTRRVASPSPVRRPKSDATAAATAKRAAASPLRFLKRRSQKENVGASGSGRATADEIPVVTGSEGSSSGSTKYF